MSDKNFKALPIQLANKLIAEIKDGNSLFQKPVKENGMPAYVKPINPTTGKSYSAMNALILAMQRRDDPRWMSADAARYAGNWVKPGEKGTMIEFSKTRDIQAIRDAGGQRIQDEAGVTQTKTVTYDKPQQTQAFLFNGEQLKDLEPLEDFLKKQEEGQTMSPFERAEKMIADSGAKIINTGREAFYDKASDTIHLPEKEYFQSEQTYYQLAVHQLAHWSGHQSRLNRPMEGKFGSLEYTHEELRASLAAMMIGAELKIGHNFAQHQTYMNNFVKILKDTPFEIAKAARDAQKISNLLTGETQKRAQKQETQAKSQGFQVGDEIAYMDETYKVLDTYKTKSIKVEFDGRRKIVQPTDGLYQNLLQAKFNTNERETSQSEAFAAEQVQEEDHSYKVGR